MRETKEYTCIVCPRGCTLTLVAEGGEVLKVEGHACKRGEAYAKDEYVHPVRTLTSTVRLADGRLLPVKTDRPIPKEALLSAADALRSLHPEAPVTIGQILLAGVAGTEANLVATDVAE